MKISELVKQLKAVEKAEGDVQVYLSHDEEGNGFATIESESISVDGGKVIIFPFREHLEYDELV